jgi:uridylate kinase
LKNKIPIRFGIFYEGKEMNGLKFKRVLLKLSGEALMGSLEYGIDSKVLKRYAQEIGAAQRLGAEIGIVIGGGNIYRGIENSTDGIDKVTGDHMGMLATVINALALQNALEHEDLKTRCLTIHPPPCRTASGKRTRRDLRGRNG